MKKTTGPLCDDAGLRRQAEARLRQHAPHPAQHDPEVDRRRLDHELDVHQVELEIQNEELRAARLELEAGLRRYTTLFDFAPMGYAILARDGRIRDINLVGARLLDCTRRQLIGLRLGAFVATEDVGALQSLLDWALTSEGQDSCELDLENHKSRLRLTASTVEDDEPTVLLAFEDISEIRDREVQLARTETALRQANRRKDEFLAVLSHELRNPLAPIRNGVFVLRHAKPGSERSRRALAIIERQADHMTRLVDDLLDVTRITSGKIELKRGRVELGELVLRTVEDHRLAFERAEIALATQFERGLLWVNGDPARLVQAVSNLLGNAEKFTERGGRVVVGLRRSGPRTALLSVRDNGAGISGSVLPHLFEPFSQAPQTAARSRGGLGLGLAMVKGLVELHGGSVAINSPGRDLGTEVTITLPLVAESVSRAKAPSSPPASAPNSRRVLVIEDNADLAVSLHDALSLAGHDVKVATDGLMGLERARSFRPEIVLCDLGLPGMDGFAVAKAFRTREELRGAYLVALSGYAQPEHVRRALEAGFDQHLAKPPSLEGLSQVFLAAPASRH